MHVLIHRMPSPLQQKNWLLLLVVFCVIPSSIRSQRIRSESYV